MVSQNADDFAFSDDASPALTDHSFEFPFKGGKASNPGLDLSQLFLSDGVGRRAGLLGVVGQAQKLFDRLKRESEFACVPNEGQSLDVRRLVNALVSGCSGRSGN